MESLIKIVNTFTMLHRVLEFPLTLHVFRKSTLSLLDFTDHLIFSEALLANLSGNSLQSSAVILIISIVTIIWNHLINQF